MLVDVYTWSMLRHGWGGVGWDDNVLCLWWHGRCYAMLGVGRGGMITFFACGHMVDATQLWCWWMCIHGRCYAMLGVLWDEYMLPCMITCTVGFGGIHIFLMTWMWTSADQTWTLGCQQVKTSSKAARCCSPFKKDNSDEPLKNPEPCFRLSNMWILEDEMLQITLDQGI